LTHPGGAGPRVLLLGGSSLLGATLRQSPEWPAGSAWTFRTLPSAPPGPDAVPLDLLDEDATRRTIERIAPTHVIDSALPAREDPAGVRRALRNLCQALRAAGPAVRYLLVSSDAVFSGEADRAYREDDPVSPGSPYGQAKADAEATVLDLLENACVARTCLLYGVDHRQDPPRPGPRVAEILTALQAGRALPFYHQQYRTPTDLDDLAAGLWKLLLSEETGIWHLAGPDRCSRAELGRATAEAFGLDPGLILDQPLPEKPQFGRDTSLDSSRARAALGWSPRTVRQGLARLAARFPEEVHPRS
jgi:dTDP-4-dehydrorhamnose reductase